jgi:hypothetical protein
VLTDGKGSRLLTLDLADLELRERERLPSAYVSLVHVRIDESVLKLFFSTGRMYTYDLRGITGSRAPANHGGP